MQCGAVTKGRPSGIKYSLMLQDPKGKEFMELTTLTRRHGEASLTTGIHIGRPGSSLTNIAARQAGLKTSSGKSSES